MGVLADLVPVSQPAYLGAGCQSGGTVGATWRAYGSAKNAAGNLIDFTAVTGTCKILTAIGGSVIATFTFSGTTTGFTIEVDESVTAGKTPGVYPWTFTLSDGTDVVQFWGPEESRFTIKAGA